MNCPHQHELSDYLLGLGDEVAAEAVEEHIASCSACKTILAGCHSEDTLVSSFRQQIGFGEFDRDPELHRALGEVSSLFSGSGPRTSNSPVDSHRRLAGNGDADAFSFDSDSASIERIGQYRLLNVIGKGGMGIVYKARHERLDMTVAIKILAEHLTHDPQAVARFEREMKAVGTLYHPNIVRATDAGTDHGRHYLVMEYIEGRDLSQIVRSHGRLRIRDACEVVRQALLAMQEAHRLGLVHRDLKPSNLMLTNDGVVKVMDLGLARLEKDAVGHGLTGDFQIMGTADFMAPEQAMQASIATAAADIYSLGCTLYKLLCGRPPFADPQHNSPLRKLMAHDQQQAVPAHSRRPEIPIALSAIVDRAMAKAPHSRFASAIEFARELEPYSVGSSLGHIPGTTRENVDGTEVTSDLTKCNITTDSSMTCRAAGGVVTISESSGVRRRGRILLAGFLFFAAILFGLVVKFRTTDGTIIVEINGDQISTALQDETLIIVDEETKNTYRLRINGRTSEQDLAPGQYTISVENPQSGLHFRAREFEIKRGTRTIVNAYLRDADSEDESQVMAGTRNHRFTDREIAIWAIQHHANIDVRINQEIRRLSRLDELPQERFSITRIGFERQTLFSDDDFARLASLPDLSSLELHDPDLTQDLMKKLQTLAHIYILRLQFDTVDPDGLEHLQMLPELQDVGLRGSRVRNEHIAQLAKLPQVFALSILSKHITDEGVEPLSRMRQLRFLSLTFCQVSGHGLQHLHDLPLLWALHLPYTRVSDEAIENIALFKEVTWLNLGATQITDEALRSVARMPKLMTLELHTTRVTEKGIGYVQSAPELRELLLTETGINDGALEILSQLTNLTRLAVGTTMSTEAVKALRNRLPNCSVEATP